MENHCDAKPLRSLDDFSAGEKEFIDQMTRKLLVDWSNFQIQSSPGGFIIGQGQEIYWEYAKSKHWVTTITSGTGRKVLSTGLAIATRFLKR